MGKLPWTSSFHLLVSVFSLVLIVVVVQRSQLQALSSAFGFASCSSYEHHLAQHEMPTSSSQYHRGRPHSKYKNASSWEGLDPPPQITLQELFSSRTPTAYPSQFSFMSPVQNPNFTSYVLPFPTQHRQHTLQNVCIEPGGRLLLVNATPDEIGQLKRDGSRRMPYLWYPKYKNCGNVTEDECVGIRSIPELPTYARYVPGNTLHFLPYYRGNTLHNIAERVWPRLALAVAPFNETTPGLPVHHFYFHRIDKVLQQAAYLDDKDQVLWQFRMLMEMWPGSDLLRVNNGEENATMCFDRFHLQMHDDERMDHSKLPPSIFGPAVRKYKAAIFRFLNLPTPEIPLPPRPLRLLFYARTELSRRRAVNHDEVLHFLQHNLSRIHVEIRSLDLLFFSKQMDYSFTRTVSIFSQTDILVIAHGGYTWATMFLPFHAGLVEVFGPCDWWKPKGKLDDQTIPMNTWVAPLTRASYIKHDMTNPFRESVANPRRGNTTLCIHPGTGVPDYTIDLPKLAQAIDSFAYPTEPGDRLTLHWLYDWKHYEETPQY